MRRLRLLKIDNFCVKIDMNDYDHYPFEYRIKVGNQWEYKNGWFHSSTSFGTLSSCIKDAKEVVNWYSKNKNPLPKKMWSIFQEGFK